MKISDVIDAIRRISPEDLQEEWDNSGIQICADKDADISRVLTALEISDSVIDEAISEQVELIVTHHPLIFKKMGQIDDNDIIGKQIIRLIRAGISVYSSHTAFDSAASGTNQYLAEQLGLSGIVPMYPAERENCGMGRIGSYDKPVSFNEFIRILDGACGKNDIRIAGKAPETVRSVSLCTGSGAEFMRDAYEMGSDVYVTGDVKYHDARMADDMGFCVIDAGHYGTEVIFAENMCEQLEAALGGEVTVIASGTDIYPFSDPVEDRSY